MEKHCKYVDYLTAKSDNSEMHALLKVLRNMERALTFIEYHTEDRPLDDELKMSEILLDLGTSLDEFQKSIEHPKQVRRTEWDDVFETNP